MKPDYSTLATGMLWSHYTRGEREHVSLEVMHCQVRFLEGCLREARQLIESHVVLWEDSRPEEAEGIPRERELLEEIWCAAARGRLR